MSLESEMRATRLFLSSMVDLRQDDKESVELPVEVTGFFLAILSEIRGALPRTLQFHLTTIRHGQVKPASFLEIFHLFQGARRWFG